MYGQVVTKKDKREEKDFEDVIHKLHRFRKTSCC